MNFEQLAQEVYTITNRPDLTAETASAVKAATLKAHLSDFYSRDIYEESISFKEKDYKQSIDLYSLVCNFRSMKYIKRFDKSDGVDYGKFFEIITPEETLDSYSRNRVDVGYIAGRMLELRSAVDFQDAIIGAYVLPIVTPTGSYSSWIAQIQSNAIITEAARVIFKMIGYDEQSAQYNQLVAEEYQLLKLTGLSDVGY